MIFSSETASVFVFFPGWETGFGMGDGDFAAAAGADGFAASGGLCSAGAALVAIVGADTTGADGFAPTGFGGRVVDAFGAAGFSEVAAGAVRAAGFGAEGLSGFVWVNTFSKPAGNSMCVPKGSALTSAGGGGGVGGDGFAESTDGVAGDEAAGAAVAGGWEDGWPGWPAEATVPAAF